MSTATAEKAARKPETNDDPTMLISRGVRARPLFDPEILRRAIQAIVREAQPGARRKEPRDVCRRSGRGTDDGIS